jgi:hypothetical protein
MLFKSTNKNLALLERRSNLKTKIFFNTLETKYFTGIDSHGFLISGK